MLAQPVGATRLRCVVKFFGGRALQPAFVQRSVATVLSPRRAPARRGLYDSADGDHPGDSPHSVHCSRAVHTSSRIVLPLKEAYGSCFPPMRSSPSSMLTPRLKPP